MKKSFLIILGLLLLSACSNEIITTQDNSTIITLERSGMFTMPEFAIQKITITNKGLLYQTFHYGGNLTNEAYTEFENNEYDKIQNVISKNEFFNLKDIYKSEINIADIGQGIITVQTNDKEKSITINPYIGNGNPNQISNIINTIDDLIAKANSPFTYNVYLTFQGKQCEENPWDIWYRESGINYIKAPTQEELIKDYYASKEITIKEVTILNNGAVCEACNICPQHNYFEIEIDNHTDINKLEEDNWKII